MSYDETKPMSYDETKPPLRKYLTDADVKAAEKGAKTFLQTLSTPPAQPKQRNARSRKLRSPR